RQPSRCRSNVQATSAMSLLENAMAGMASPLFGHEDLGVGCLFGDGAGLSTGPQAQTKQHLARRERGDDHAGETFLSETSPPLSGSRAERNHPSTARHVHKVSLHTRIIF